jgi:Domain of unknown function (DUF4411)
VLYRSDANVLITASNTYYPIDQVPEFWAWLKHQGKLGNIKLPVEMLEEIRWASIMQRRWDCSYGKITPLRLTGGRRSDGSPKKTIIPR